MTKQDQKAECKKILNKYDIGDYVLDEFDFLISIFKNHQDWENKKGVGVKYIEVVKDSYGHRCFDLIRIDGTETDISYLKSISPPKKNYRRDIKIACRTAIRPVILDFRNKNVVFGETKCAITGEVLIKSETDIDHYDLTFNDMFDSWVDGKDLKYLHSQIGHIKQSLDFINIDLKQDFINYHNKHCKLRATTSYANRVVLNQGYTFRPHQVTKSKELLAVLLKYKIAYLAGQVRSGKSLTALETVRLYGAKNVLFITKKKAISSINDDYDNFGFNYRLTVINYESLHKLETIDFDLVIYDEAHSCFLGNTKIDGVKIKDIKIGSSQKSFNFAKNVYEYKKVKNVFKNKLNENLIKIKCNGKEIVCTESHKIFTKRGWVEARSILPTDELQVV